MNTFGDPPATVIINGSFPYLMSQDDAPIESSTGRRSIYRDLVSTGKEELEFQVRIMLDRFDRTDRLVRLAVATLAGMVAVLGFLMSHGPSPRVGGAVLLGASILAVMSAVYLLVRINTSLHRETTWELGPNIRDVVGFVEEDDTDDEEYSRFMVGQLPDHIESNTAVIRSMSARQDRAIMVVVVGVILHLGAIAFILGGAILG